MTPAEDVSDAAPREREWHWLVRVALVLGTMGLYVATFLPMYRMFGRPAFSLAIVPTVVGGALLGPWGVAGTTLVLYAANAQFALVVHYPTDRIVASAVPTTAASIMLGLGAAALARLLSERRATNRRLAAEVRQRRATEEALRQSSRLHEALVESLGAGVALFDETDCCVYANHAAAQVIGVAVQELLGQPFTQWWDEATRECRRSLAPSVDTGYHRYEVTLATQGNRVLLVSETPWQEESRQASARTLRVFHDVTERVELERQQRRLEVQLERNQALQSLAVLAGGVVHDFNNLLSSVVGNAELALANLPPATPPAVREILHELTRFAMEAGQLSKQMLAYAGGRALSLQPTNLNCEVEQTLKLLQTTIETGARLTVRLDPSIPELLADRVQIRQILTNFVLNALESIHPGRGVLTVSTTIERRPPTRREGGQTSLVPEARTESGLLVPNKQAGASAVPLDRPPGDYAVLTVSDTGKGIAPEHLPQIFEPFYSTKDQGRGMGLAACMGIARGHHGWIDVESEPGVGTTFSLKMPLARSAVTSEREAATPSC